MSNKEILEFKFWSTSITRFNAAKRTVSWKNCIRWSLLASSIYLTTLSILIYAGKVKSEYSEISHFAAIFLSILIMCLSLSVNLNQYEVKAFKYHECGRKIRRLLSKLTNTTDDPNIVNTLSTKYDDILDKYENHMSIDYYQFILHNLKKLSEEQKSKIPPCYLIYIWMPIARYIPQILIYFLVIIVPLNLILEIVSF